MCEYRSRIDLSFLQHKILKDGLVKSLFSFFVALCLCLILHITLDNDRASSLILPIILGRRIAFEMFDMVYMRHKFHNTAYEIDIRDKHINIVLCCGKKITGKLEDVFWGIRHYSVHSNGKKMKYRWVACILSINNTKIFIPFDAVKDANGLKNIYLNSKRRNINKGIEEYFSSLENEFN